MAERPTVKLHGRIFFTATIRLESGLHIGGAAGGLEIGGVDKPVIRNPLNSQPYIPGSSLKGKMRSLLEKAHAAPQNHEINNIFIHLAKSEEEYDMYPISSIFGSFPETEDKKTSKKYTLLHPTRLTVRDVPLTEESRKRLSVLKTDLPYTEVKWEAAIDRVTSAATPRQIERVPAGAEFGPAEVVYSVYTPGTEHTATTALQLFRRVIEALALLEDDYLGGMGTRGNGRIRFINPQVSVRVLSNYGAKQEYQLPAEAGEATIATFAAHHEHLTAWLEHIFNGTPQS